MTMKIEPMEVNPQFPPTDEKPRQDGTNQGFLVFPHTVVSIRTEARVAAQPQVIFKPKRLVVDPACAPFFHVLDIRIGKNSFFLNSGDGAPATLFPPLPIYLTEEERANYELLTTMKLDVCQVSQIISLNILHVSPTNLPSCQIHKDCRDSIRIARECEARTLEQAGIIPMATNQPQVFRAVMWGEWLLNY